MKVGRCVLVLCLVPAATDRLYRTHNSEVSKDGGDCSIKSRSLIIPSENDAHSSEP